jgi:peptidoglycan/LPS O-acetylase OafA/YrhL
VLPHLAVQAGRVASLDGLRAISILLVVMSHLLGTKGFPLGPRALGAAGDLGYLGVRVFFVISGYLITNLLIAEHAKHGHISLRGFYLRRAYRILPAASALIVSIAIVAWAGGVDLRPGDLPAAATYTMNYHYDRAWELGHLWSLSVEEQFYLVWPVLLVVLGVRRIVPLSALFLVLAPIVRVIVWRSGYEHRDDMIMEAYPCVMDSIAAGCLLAGLRPWLDRQKWYRYLTEGPGFVAIVALIALAEIPTDIILLDYVVDISAINLAIAIFVDRFVRYPSGPVGVVLNWRPIMFVGTLSYSLYLWQQPFLNHRIERTWTEWPVNVVLAIACALGSYYLVEKPFLALRDRRARARRATTAPPPAASPPSSPSSAAS